MHRKRYWIYARITIARWNGRRKRLGTSRLPVPPQPFETSQMGHEVSRFKPSLNSEMLTPTS